MFERSFSYDIIKTMNLKNNGKTSIYNYLRKMYNVSRVKK